MKETSSEKTPKRLHIPLTAAVFCSLTLTVWVSVLLFHLLYERFVTAPPVFFDFIIEATAESGFNKAGEILLFRLLAAGGLILMSGFSVFFYKKYRLSDAVDVTDASSTGPFSFTLPLLPLAAAIVYLLIWGTFSGPLFFLAGYTSLILFYVNHRRKDLGDCLPFFCVLPILSYYGVLGCLTLLTLLSPRFAVSTSVLYVLTLFLTFASLLILHKKPKVTAGILLLFQLPIPLLLTVYLRDSYSYNGQILRVPYAGMYYVLILAAMAAAYISLFIRFRKKDNGAASLNLIARATPVILFVYRSYQCCPMFAQPDQHHHGEQMIPWQQLMDLSQSPYREYSPVSGLFPLVNGFIQNVLFSGTVSDYAPALSLTTALFAAVTMYLICLHIGQEKALILAVLFSLPAYNRQYMVLPVLLLIFLPALREHTGHWIRVWLFSCFLAGLYYPLFGGAVLIGTLPLFLRRLAVYIKSKQLSEDLKKKSFYLLWALTLLPILLCLPLLLRMASHTLTYSSQTILADGISLAGQTPPDRFLTYLSSFSFGDGLRNSLYLIYRFFLPALWLWIPVPVIILKRRSDRELSDAALAALLTLAVSYTYTLVRADVFVILARTAPVLTAVGGMFLAVFLIKRKPAPFSTALLCLCLSLPFLCWSKSEDLKTPALWTYPDGDSQLVADDASRLFTSYEVPESFGKMSDEQLLTDAGRLGSGFMVRDQYSYLRHYDAVLQKVKAAGFDDCPFMGYDGQGFYYYLNTKACGTGYLPVARSRAAQKRLIDAADNARPVIFPLDPAKSYYLYRHITEEVTDYVYAPGDDCFYPAEIYTAIYGAAPADRGLSQYAANADPELDLGRICQSFGNSNDSLLVLTDAQALDPDSEEGTLAGQADLLAISFDREKLANALGTRDPVTLQLSFGESASGGCITCLLSDSDLLIPLGMHVRWLIPNNRKQLTFSFFSGDTLLFTTDAPGLSEYLSPDFSSGFYHIR